MVFVNGRLRAPIFFSADTAHLITSPKQHNSIRLTVSADQRWSLESVPWFFYTQPFYYTKLQQFILGTLLLSLQKCQIIIKQALLSLKAQKSSILCHPKGVFIAFYFHSCHKNRQRESQMETLFNITQQSGNKAQTFYSLDFFQDLLIIVQNHISKIVLI